MWSSIGVQPASKNVTAPAYSIHHRTGGLSPEAAAALPGPTDCACDVVAVAQRAARQLSRARVSGAKCARLSAQFAVRRRPMSGRALGTQSPLVDQRHQTHPHTLNASRALADTPPRDSVGRQPVAHRPTAPAHSFGSRPRLQDGEGEGTVGAPLAALPPPPSGLGRQVLARRPSAPAFSLRCARCHPSHHRPGRSVHAALRALTHKPALVGR